MPLLTTLLPFDRRWRLAPILVALFLAGGAILESWTPRGLPAADAQNNSTDWPQWRGPNRDGISPLQGLKTDWTGGLNVAWQVNNLGDGYASLAIQGDRIYTMGEQQNTEFLMALNREGGAKLWETSVGGHSDNGGYPGPRCTPTADGERVYALGSRGDLVCVNAVDGSEIWRKSLSRDFKGKMMSGWGYTECPLVDGDALICTPGGKEHTVVALNKLTGETLWSCAVPDEGDAGKAGAGYSSCVIANCGGVKQYVQLLGRGLVGIDAATGKLLWTYNRVAGKVANIPTPVVRGDYVFGSTGYGDGGAALVKIVKNGEQLAAEEVYYLSAEEFRNHHGGMILIGDYIYGGDGQNKGFPTCLEFLTGKRAWGEKKIRGPGEGSAAIIAADGYIIWRYQNGLLALIPANPQKYEVTATFQLPTSDKPSWPHPAIAGDKLYIRDQGALYCYELK
ncbi:MAG: PQQ-binding-like beta-propeller repeat protein [Pirellulales bacterium]|nr:PQQ-binding-like beta-propeller repeat protein [Pirellulales bacterium]